MVPHGPVEEALHAALGLTEQALCVTSVPDAAQGERLAVVHALPDEKIDELLAKLPAAGLPNLWLPRRDAFVRVAALPLLGTGKLDLKRVGELAREALAGKQN
jgi:acyl-[acyl-carrier-protein]-phospholipid O-acyltransferase/long-chain-fatty-acid--[acyl-carrier-protein] ligase